MSDRRPKRRCVAAKAQRQQGPSAIHYVGYVEDEETPEMIMKKFEELERIQKAAEARRQQQQQPSQAAGATPPPAPADGAGPSNGGGPPDADLEVPHPTGRPDGMEEVPGPYPDGERGQLEQQDHAGAAPARPGGGGGDAVGASSGGPGGAGCIGEAPLDEEALLEVFKQTSIFNVRANGDAGAAGDAGPARYDLYGGYGVSYGMEDALLVEEDGGDAGSDVDEEELQYMKGFWSDEDYELGGSRNRDGAGGGRRRRPGGGSRAERSDGGAGGGGGAPRQPRAGGGGSGASRHAVAQMVTQLNRDTNALIRRRVAGGASGGGDGLVQLRLPPPPLPLSWGRTVRPYQPPEPCRLPEPYGAAAMAGTVATTGTAASDAAAASRGFEASDVATFPYDSALSGKTYVAVMVNAGWQPAGAADAYEEGSEAEVMARFRRLPIPRLVPRGFVLVWAHKGLLAAVCRQLAAWGYVYVENLTWVHITPANAIAALPGRHFRRSHSTMLMFRKDGEGRDIELRHQRNPDVIFDCIRTREDGGGWELPNEVWGTVETLLPTGKGAFLELWAPRGARRPGWDHVSEVSEMRCG
ncbi:hypothetical protein GPECTOR_60g727 [Gonium pectorale]|uniref:MT-A70 protein n=1 Tax=Gonium pectorale TaxID=33097 RepID=A0A150G6H2_GONPE|nr:hypothetical protein GPECTOR_60g727 [Gonium pectorale]|eukprot:KXZ44950.1 hypothetical protein GPECTOR_60g727 [Gonium pectorale]